MWTRGLRKNQQLSVFFGHGSMIGRRKPERRIVVLGSGEARLLSKYRGLVFNGPDSRTTFSVWDKNLEYRRGRGNGWFVVGVSADHPDDESYNEPFTLEMACELIRATKQKEGVKVLREEME
jgi:hypothetical protein